MDPDSRLWGRTYPHFPGVAECVRLIRAGKARGAWADFITYELAENAATCLNELVETFRTDEHFGVREKIMMALEIARVPESVPFLAEVLQEAEPAYAGWASKALRRIDTREARTVVWNAENRASS